jgi:hypothetical protein
MRGITGGLDAYISVLGGYKLNSKLGRILIAIYNAPQLT